MCDKESGLCIPFTLNGTFSAFASRSLNEKEIESAEDYETVFLTPDSNSCDPYDGLYKTNKDSYLDSSGRMITPTVSTHHDLVGVADVSAAQASGGNNDVEYKSTDKASSKSVLWREDMISNRERRKASHKIQRTLRNASFELAVSEAELDGLSCDMNSFEALYPAACDFQGECPPLPQPDSWDHNIDIQLVHHLPVVSSAINSVIETSVLVEGSGVPKTSEEFEDDCELFRMDAISKSRGSFSQLRI